MAWGAGQTGSYLEPRRETVMSRQLVLERVAASVFLVSLGGFPLGSGATPVLALGDATATVSSYYDFSGLAGTEIHGPLASNLTLALDQSVSGTSWPYGFVHAQAAGNVNASLGTTYAGSGAVDAETTVVGTGATKVIQGGTGGAVSYFVTLRESVLPPTPIASVPIRFSANGDGYLKGDVRFSGGYDAGARLDTDGFPAGLFSISHVDSVGASQDSFAQSTSLWIDVQRLYSVMVYASCYAVTGGGWDPQPPPNGTPITHWAECGAHVDPLIALDQDAFDTRYGADSFPLADYISLAFSPNIPSTTDPVVPEPPIAPLVLTALAGLTFMRLKVTPRGCR